MSTKSKTSEKPAKEVTISYKIRMVIDIEGEVECQPPLRDETGIEPFLQWAVDDIEKNLDCCCEIVGVKKVELEEK